MNENGQEKRETLADIVADMRKAGALMPTAYMRDLLNYADRIEAAWRREKYEIEANALFVGGVVEAARHTPGNATVWKETCARCMDGEIEPQHCEYYGEPNGCNSPTYGEHPTVGNAAAMHEALERLDALNLDVLKFPLDGDSSEIFDADKKPITLPAWGVATLLNEAKEAQVLARAALSAPARNCDVYKTSWDVVTHWDGGLDSAKSVVRMLDWLLSPAKSEKKGESNGSK